MKETISLKRILAKKDIAALIQHFETITESKFAVTTEKMLGKGDFLLSFPIQVSDQTIGWVAGEKNGALFLAELLSSLAKEEYEKKALGRETLDRYKELNLIYDVAVNLSVNLTQEEVAEIVINEAHRLIKGEHIEVMLLKEDCDCLEVLASSTILTTDDRTKIDLGAGIEGYVALFGKGEIIDDVTADHRFIPHGLATGSMLCAPLKTKNELIGVISVRSSKKAEYTSGDLKLLSSLAFLMASAIQNISLYNQLEKGFVATVHSLVETIEKRDLYTGGHTKRVMDYSLIIGKALKLSSLQIKRLELAAVLHDIGKIGIRDNILLKQDRLTEEEFMEIQRHTSYGEEILSHIKMLEDVIPGIKQHHERFDGTGYPENLSGYEIDITARIIAVADTFDAMTTDRPYQKGLSADIALAELKRNAGKQFDPEIVAVFVENYKKIRR